MRTREKRQRGRTNEVELLSEGKVLDNDEFEESLLVGIRRASPLHRVVLPFPSRGADLKKKERWSVLAKRKG